MLKSLLLSFFLIAGPAFASEEFTIEGDMHKSELEGGCWYLDVGGKHYELLGDQESLERVHVDDRHVKLRVKKESAASICMMGESLRITEVLDTVRHPIDIPVFRNRL